MFDECSSVSCQLVCANFKSCLRVYICYEGPDKLIDLALHFRIGKPSLVPRLSEEGEPGTQLFARAPER